MALEALIAMRSTIRSQVTGYQAQAEALDVAIGICEGTLQTQLTELETLKSAQSVAVVKE